LTEKSTNINKNTEKSVKLEQTSAQIAGSKQGETAKDVKTALQLSSTTQALLAKDLEKKDNEARKNNAILYGLPESESTAMTDIQEFMKRELFKNFDQPEQAIRLSQKISGKSRPIKLRFADEKAKWDFIKRVNANLRGEEMFCKLDVSKDVREQEFKLREEVRTLKQKQDGTGYRVRSMNIQQKTESGEWENMKPAINKHSTV
jgi:hypothetical protein